MTMPMNGRRPVTMVFLVLALAAACSDDSEPEGAPIRYTDRGGRDVEVYCSNPDDPHVLFADDNQPTLDYHQDAVDACYDR